MRTKQEFKTWVDNVIFLAELGIRCNNLMTCGTRVDEVDVNRLAEKYRAESKTAFWVRRK